MARLIIQSPSEQVASHLRERILCGEIKGEMPGTPQLSERLGVDRKTIMAAMDLLGREGLLEAQGAGKRRRILVPEGEIEALPLRVAILLYEPDDRREHYVMELLSQLQSRGFHPYIASRTLRDMKMDVAKVAKHVGENEADAWVVIAGSLDVLGWFVNQPIPAFSLFGRASSFQIACTGPVKTPALKAAVGRLVDLGHRRIVMLAFEERRKPVPALFETNFLKILENHGIQTGAYNLPDWEENKVGFHRMLESLFRHSPPTAIIAHTVTLYAAAKDHLSRRGMLVPENVSMICIDPAPTFAWCEHEIAHMSWDSKPSIRRIVRWVDNIARGKEDFRQRLYPSKFLEGGTIGPVPGNR